MNKGLKFDTHKNFPKEKVYTEEGHYESKDTYPLSSFYEDKGFNTALSTVGNLGRRLDVDKMVEIMLNISKAKSKEQIAEVDKKGLWGADLITVELKDFAIALSTAYDKGLLTEDV